MSKLLIQITYVQRVLEGSTGILVVVVLPVLVATDVSTVEVLVSDVDSVEKLKLLGKVEESSKEKL